MELAKLINIFFTLAAIVLAAILRTTIKKYRILKNDAAGLFLANQGLQEQIHNLQESSKGKDAIIARLRQEDLLYRMSDLVAQQQDSQWALARVVDGDPGSIKFQFVRSGDTLADLEFKKIGQVECMGLSFGDSPKTFYSLEQTDEIIGKFANELTYYFSPTVNEYQC